MLPPQDVKDKEFTKAVFGGYDMESVDDFLEILFEDYSSLYKENAILKNKLKVLVEKVEEYRSTEAAMRMALLTAQKMSQEMVEEATNKSKNIVEEAEIAAKSKIDELRNEVRAEERQLETAKRTTAEFIATAAELYKTQLDFLAGIGKFTAQNELKSAPAESAAIESEDYAPKEAPVEENKKSLEDSVARIYENTIRSEDTERGFSETGDEDIDFFGEERDKLIEENTRVFVPAASKTDQNADKADEPMSPKPKFDFKNLQFGSNYDQEK